jgi:uncharacterized Zn finger protein (UPF0148 family)
MAVKPAMKRKRESESPAALQCPACEAPLNIQGIKSRQRVQCPRCRSTVEPVSAGAVDDASPPQLLVKSGQVQAADRQEERIRHLEERIARLERMLESKLAESAAASAAVQHEPVAVKTTIESVKPELAITPGASSAPATAETGRLAIETPHRVAPSNGAAPATLTWLDPNLFSDYSPKQAEVLAENLRVIRNQAITVQFAAGNEAACRRAEWFVQIFKGAQWEVHGPEHTSDRVAFESELALVTSLPVSNGSGATYVALRAAGFLVSAVYRTDAEHLGNRLVVG